MKLQDVIDEIKLEVFACGILEGELEDTQLKSVVQKALREIERYIDEATLVTVPYSSCIDLTGWDHSSIVKVYRTSGTGISSNEGDGTGLMDPMYAQWWTLYGNGSLYNINDYVLNYAAWTTMSQIRNTISTDLAFREDKHANKLYINAGTSTPSMITIEYIPKLTNVEDITSDYWIDILIRISVALTKIVVGRLRSRFTQSNALWSQDGEKILEEGNTEYKELREVLRSNSNYVYGID